MGWVSYDDFAERTKKHGQRRVFEALGYTWKRPRGTNGRRDALRCPRKLRYCSHRLPHPTPLRTLTSSQISLSQARYTFCVILHQSFRCRISGEFWWCQSWRDSLAGKSLPNLPHSSGIWNLVNDFIYHLWVEMDTYSLFSLLILWFYVIYLFTLPLGILTNGTYISHSTEAFGRMLRMVPGCGAEATEAAMRQRGGGWRVNQPFQGLQMRRFDQSRNLWTFFWGVN